MKKAIEIYLAMGFLICAVFVMYYLRRSDRSVFLDEEFVDELADMSRKYDNGVGQGGDWELACF